ncbi:MAG: hypothetical protein HY290_16300 [Planctomycetia bacterium]|nr:hypothetical protein [Planctomycetia bacterium]
MRIAFLKRPLALVCSGLAAACLFAGCPEQATVTVTMKPVAGAAKEGGADASAESTTAAGYGTLVGTITYEGDAKALPPLVAAGDATLKAEDRAVCAVQPVPNESLLVNSANKGLANVIIFLEKRPANIKPELAKPPSDPVMFDQKGCVFLPHVLVVQVGQPLLVVSDDPIPHNTHTRPKRNNEFNQVIAPKDRSGKACDYKKPESGPLSVVCDLHTWMKAYHFPVDHPYAAVTDKDGKFKIEGLPAGKHSFNVWHERGPGDSQLLERKLQITIEIDKETTKDLSYGPSKLSAVPRQVSIRPATSLALAAAALAADDKPAPGTGNFKGVVTLKGKAPERKVLHRKGDPNVKDPAVCAAEDMLDDDFLVNEKADNGVANVVIYLKKAPEGYKAPPPPEVPAVFDQKGCRFVPHVLALRVNQPLLLKSNDPAPHNTNIKPVRNTGFNQVIAPNNRTGEKFKYTKPETLPIPVSCDFHRWMKAHHLPLEHPFFAVTDENGKFEIKGLPPGKHMFTVWQEVGGYVKGLNNKLEVEIKADQVTEKPLSFTAADFKVGN